MKDLKEYDFPVYYTQGGGYAREVNGTYIFITEPKCPGFTIGDEVPAEWGLIFVNQKGID